MSTRISKDIGYFIGVKKVNKILTKNWLNKIDDFDDSLLVSFIKEAVDSYVELDLNKVYVNYLLTSEKWNLEKLIIPSYDFDTFKGVLFKTPELNSERRFDNAVDYYSEPDMKYKVNHFFRPIYPRNGYVYIGGVTDLKIINKIEDLLGYKLKLGTLIDGQNIAFVVKMIGCDSTKDKHEDFVKQIKRTKVLIPDVDPLVYLIAKASGVLKEGISSYEFRKLVRPAIVTSWG